MSQTLNREMLNRQLNRLYATKTEQLNRSLIEDTGATTQTISIVGFMAAIEQVLVMINTLPGDAA